MTVTALPTNWHMQLLIFVQSPFHYPRIYRSGERQHTHMLYCFGISKRMEQNSKAIIPLRHVSQIHTHCVMYTPSSPPFLGLNNIYFKFMIGPKKILIWSRSAPSVIPLEGLRDQSAPSRRAVLSRQTQGKSALPVLSCFPAVLGAPQCILTNQQIHSQEVRRFMSEKLGLWSS